MDTIITLGPDSRIIQGGSAAAHDLTRLRENNVDLLINCTTNIPNPSWHRAPNTPAVTNFPVCDAMVFEGGSILDLLEPVFDEVRNCFAKEKNVMIHCRAGIHRAGTMGVILAMEFLNLNAKDALRHVQKHRRDTRVLGQLWALVLRVAEKMKWRRPRSAARAAPPATPPTYSERIPAAPAAPATQQRSAASAAPPGLPLSAAPAAPGPGVTLVSLSSESESDVEESAIPYVHQRSSVVLRPAEQPSPQVVLRPAPWSPAAPAAAEEEQQTSPAAPAAAEEEQQTMTHATGHRLFTSTARLSYADATGRLLLMSWNPGWGVKNLAQIIDTRGYHVVAVQEARPDFLSNLSRDRWSYVIAYQQFVGVRHPNLVQSHMAEEIEKKSAGTSPLCISKISSAWAETI